MKPLIPLTLTLACSLTLSGQPVEITDWQGARTGAISLTFDDSPANHWTNAAPVMTAAGIRGTFAVVTNSVDWNGARAAALDGHEIGSHSTDGNRLDTLSFTDAANRMEQSHNTIETEISSAVPGYHCHVIAWPFGKRRLDVVNDAAYKDLYVSARNAGNSLGASNSYNSADTTQWWKFGLGTFGLDHYFVIGDALMNSGISLTSYNNQLDLVEAQGAWTVFTYHGVPDTGASGLSVNKADFTDQMAALAARKDTTLWVAPYGEVARYVRQRDDATAAVTTNTGSSITISLTDSLPDSVYSVPLTLRIDTPAGWTGVLATQGGVPIPASVGGGKVTFDAVPDAGTILLEQAGGPAPVIPVLSIDPVSVSVVSLSWQSEVGTAYEIKHGTDMSSFGSFSPPVFVIGDGSELTEQVPYNGSGEFFQLEVSAP